MQSIFSMLAGEHALHGDLFTRACGGVREGDWGGAGQALTALTEAIELYLRIEDDCILRPLAKDRGLRGVIHSKFFASIEGVVLQWSRCGDSPFGQAPIVLLYESSRLSRHAPVVSFGTDRACPDSGGCVAACNRAAGEREGKGGALAVVGDVVAPQGLDFSSA